MHLKISAILAMGLVVTPAAAQTQSAGLGPTDKLIRLRRPDGRPCLAFSTMSQADTILPNTFHHYVEVDNGCPRVIAVKICYKNYAESCQSIQVAPHDATTTMLGTMTGQPQFEYDFTEH